MSISTLNSIKHLILEMMNDEHDEHAKLLSDIKKRVIDQKLLETLILVHSTKFGLLEEIFQKLKEKK